jgi:lipopolysaccharide export system permease protein
MIKKLDKLIFKSFIGPFVITFFIALFVLIMQSMWKYIDDLVGKGLGFLTIIKFVWYASATLLPLAMPIAILISSIMTFGNLGESFELVAIKSSGISLLRFMRPLMFFTVLLCFITFLFANYVMPYSQLKFVTLYKDILVQKPSLDLKQGSFYTGIDKYAIKVGKKNEDGKQIEKILIYDQSNPLQDNTIIAKKGKMDVTKDNYYLAFNLQDGSRYQEKGLYSDSATEYIRLEFKTFKKLFDLSAFQQNKGDEDAYKSNFKMLSAKQLSKNMDSIKIVNDSVFKNISKTIKLNLTYLNDTAAAWAKISKSDVPKADHIFPLENDRSLNERALSKANELKNTLTFANNDYKSKVELLKNHKVEWHRKFSFSLACMVLFFIGAPLGSIIRKGGLGMPLVVAIIFFLIFHLLNVFGEKFAHAYTLSPFMGMWMAVFLLTPVGAFLTYKALNDSQIFNKDVYVRAFNKIKTNFINTKQRLWKTKTVAENS